MATSISHTPAPEPPPPGIGSGPGSPPAGVRPGPVVGAEATKGTPVLLPDGWVATVTDRIVSTVDTVRAKTTTPIEKIGRIVIWGLLIATAGVALLIALLTAVMRVLYVLIGRIPGISGREGRSVWIIDILLGVGLIAVGMLLIKRGTKPQQD